MSEAKSRALYDRQYVDRIVAAAPAVNTQTNYDVGFYDIFMRVNDTTQIVYGAVRMVATIVEPSVSQIQLDFFDNMTIDSCVGPPGNYAYSRASNVVTVTLDKMYNPGAKITVVIGYHGHPTEGGFQAFSFRTRSGKKVIASLSEPYYARTWWPCKDRNDDKADSLKACIEVDTSFYVGSNGSLDSIRTASPNTKRFYYAEHYPIVSYLFSVAISPYTVWNQFYRYNGNQDSMLITHAVYSDFFAYSQSHWGITPQAIGLLVQSYGQYPFITEKYGHSNFEWGGGMEHQTMTSMIGDTFGFQEDVVVHELAHQWTGDMITCESWHDIWLNEGWASYSEAIYYLNRDGWASYHNWMATMDWNHNGSVYVTDTTSVGSIFSRTVYDKGAWLIHMLRGVMGETKFAQFLNTYFNSEYRFKWLTSVEFQALAETVAGEDLDWFFQEWLYGVKRPAYNWAYYTEPAAGGGFDTWIWVQQVQLTNPQVFRMPIEFAFDYSGFPTDTITLVNDARRNILKAHTTNQPVNVSFDPDKWVLKYVTYLDWNFRIISSSADLKTGKQFTLYRDTVETKAGTGPYDPTFVTGTLPPGLTIGSDNVISGTPTDTGTYSFTLRIRDMWSGYSDQVDLSIRIVPADYLPGDVNFSQVMVDLPDLSALVSYLTGSGYIIPVPKLADVNNDCSIDLFDLSILVSYLTGGGATLVLGCAQ
jgi:aminopeptidase N